MTEPICTDLTGNCSDCCAIFTDPALREAFGYQELEAECLCHDICVEDVRLICVEERTLVIPIPGVDGANTTCRGGRVIGAQLPFTLDSVTVTCAEETLAPTCDAVNNEVGLQVVLSFVVAGVQTFLVLNRSFDFACTQFFTFPEGELRQGAALREELQLIDGSCKVIIIEDTRIVSDTLCPRVEVDLKIIDKLWKHENLLVSAIKPYPENVTVSETFARNFIGPCVAPPCPGVIN